ncbi:MAG: LemA family protein [Treponema sp.]|nr:LemA family protein [Treponema sp.]
MKKGLIGIIVVVVAVLGIYNFWKGNYNQMVTLDEGVKSQWAQVQNQYQRRLDLIPNLVATVQGYAAHEASVFTQVAQARAEAGGVVNIDSSVLEDPEAFKKYQAIQDNLSSSLQRLLAVQENYPELKANENFMALQDELEGTENRIATERKRFNESAQEYNIFIRQFPRSIIANISGFRPKAYFEASAQAQSAPVVSF